MRHAARGCLVAGLLAILAGPARGAMPTVAIMPLRDLAGGRPTVGAALRETLTADLLGTPGLKVVERAVIDRVMKEQDFDHGKQLEGVGGVRIGTLLGASHLITGAYQREGKTLRVTARVIAVETGQIVGSAKVDGELEHMLELQDRASAQLLASVGWKAPPSGLPKRKRPRLTARTIERYGDAVLEPDTEKKKTILREVVKDSPEFSYAVDALALLEGRLAGYEAATAATLSTQEHALLSAATDGKNASAARSAKIMELLSGMARARRFHSLTAALDKLASAPAEAKETIAYYRFVALEGLRRIDEALAAGEAVLAKFPGGPHFHEVETKLRALADVRRVRAARRAEYEADLKEKRTDLGSRAGHEIDWDWAPCIAARWNRQINEFMLDGCRAFLKTQGESKVPEAMEHAKAGRLFVILALGEMGRFAEARKEIAEFRKRYPMGDEEIDGALAMWPTD